MAIQFNLYVKVFTVQRNEICCMSINNVKAFGCVYLWLYGYTYKCCKGQFLSNSQDHIHPKLRRCKDLTSYKEYLEQNQYKKSF